MKVIFKNDKYKKARGGRSRLLRISCQECGSSACSYQKDGPGNLRRLYLDRIFSPKNLVDLQKQGKLVPNLNCNQCKEVLGILYIYQKEKRKAFRLFQDAVVKKVRKLI